MSENEDSLSTIITADDNGKIVGYNFKKKKKYVDFKIIDDGEGKISLFTLNRFLVPDYLIVFKKQDHPDWQREIEQIIIQIKNGYIPAQEKAKKFQDTPELYHAHQCLVIATYRYHVSLRHKVLFYTQNYW